MKLELSIDALITDARPRKRSSDFGKDTPEIYDKLN